MLARLPTTLHRIARTIVCLVCVVVAHGLGRHSVAPCRTLAQTAAPVVVESGLPSRFANPTPPSSQPVVPVAPVVIVETDASPAPAAGPSIRSAPPLQLDGSRERRVDSRAPRARSSPVAPSQPSVPAPIVPPYAAAVVVEPVPGFEVFAPSQRQGVVRPAVPMHFVLADPTRTRTKSMARMRLSDVANPTRQSTVVPAQPSAETLEFLRLSEPPKSSPAAAAAGPSDRARSRPTTSSSLLSDSLLKLSDPMRRRQPSAAPPAKLPYIQLTPNAGFAANAPKPSAARPRPTTVGPIVAAPPLGMPSFGLSESPRPQINDSKKFPALADIAPRQPSDPADGLLLLSDTAAKPDRAAALVEQTESRQPNPRALAANLPPATPRQSAQPKPTPRRADGIADRNPQSEDIKMLRMSEEATPQRRSVATQAAPPEVIPLGFEPWWQDSVMRQLRPAPQSLNVDVNSLIVDALRYSAQIQAISDEAIIAQTAITRAAAEFDTEAFMETRLVRTDVPTGSTLDAGDTASRLRELDWKYTAGLRKKNHYGGRFEVAQEIGTKNSTSEFFSPTQQGNSRLTLSYNQPLLNGGGEVYNSSLILMAKVDSTVALDRTSSQLQDQLLEVTESMWELYIQRSLMLQKRRHLERATAIHERLVRRRGIDVLESQVARAGAAVATRRTELIRAETAVRNAEAFLRSLVNSPALLADRSAEIVPVQSPASYFVPVDLHDALATALNNRPDIDAAAQELEAARVRLKVARNELMPVLDAVLETYVSGIRGGYNISGSWEDQFQIGKPSYTAGLVFENPIHRRSAKANHLKRRVELRQLSNQFKATVESLNADVEVAVREVETAFREMQATYQSMTAAQSDADYLKRRWESLPGDDRAASFMLEDLLDAQDRLAAAEFEFTRSQVAYTLSLTYLNRATGTLLKQEEIKMIHSSEQGLPTIRFEKADATPTHAGSEQAVPSVASSAMPLHDPAFLEQRP